MLSLMLLGVSMSASGQVHVSGSIQSDVLLPQKDDKIGAEEYDEFALTNTYADVSLTSKHIDAGVRMEFMQYPLPGFENKFKGWGVPHAYIKGHFEKLELTAGTFYDQFGSGFIFRTYEERSLGIDNALLGGRVVYKPTTQITLKALTGKQRQYWSLADSWISGADAEWNIADLTFGASFVNKHEGQEVMMTDATHKLNLPEHVNAFDLRVQLQKNGLGLLAEYAWKSQDPSYDNGYIYRQGYVAMLSASYSKRGSSILVQAKRSDNMSFRSERSVTGTSSFINHLPAFTMDHTYALAALYPYATQPDGEWAVQGSAAYTFKRKSKLGGKYGMTVKLNVSHVRNDGETYYQDINVQLERKFTQKFKLNLMYMNQKYNQTVMEGEGGMIHSNIGVVEGRYQFNKKLTLRAELQYLHTPDDDGDWIYGLAELSIVPHWMLSIADMYNVGETKTHYYQGSVTYNIKSHRIQLGYVRNRAGFNCSGGVCRRVPASKGVTLSYNYNF